MAYSVYYSMNFSTVKRFHKFLLKIRHYKTFGTMHIQNGETQISQKVDLYIWICYTIEDVTIL